LKDGIDYVKCQLCNLHCQKLSYHIELFHNLTIKEYAERYGNTISQILSSKYSLANRAKIPWQTIAKENGEDLTKFYADMGKNLTLSLMNNPKERARRSNLMTSLWKDGKLGTDEMIWSSSEAAKKTSARPEIIEQRSKNLANWREKNPEDFAEKCWKPMLKAKPTKPTWFSKPEKILFNFLRSLPDFDFMFNQVVESDKFHWASKRKQVDIGDKSKRIYIEFDGPYHSHLFNKNDATKFNEIKLRDILLEECIEERQWILVRISYDQFHDSKTKGNEYFQPDCLEMLLSIIRNNRPGVYKLGKYYGQY
jgi:hypothetical protein